MHGNELFLSHMHVLATKLVPKTDANPLVCDDVMSLRGYCSSRTEGCSEQGMIGAAEHGQLECLRWMQIHKYKG